MTDQQIKNYWYWYLYKNYPFIEWGFDFKKNSMGEEFIFTATNLVTDTTYSISVAILSILIEYYHYQIVEYIEQNVKSLVEKIKDESAKKLLNGMEKIKPRCDECVNASINDRDLDYTPNLHCKLDHETFKANIMEFYPKEETCEDFKEGDPEYL